jgi:hypothetical protein
VHEFEVASVGQTLHGEEIERISSTLFGTLEQNNSVLFLQNLCRAGAAFSPAINITSRHKSEMQTAGDPRQRSASRIRQYG